MILQDVYAIIILILLNHYRITKSIATDKSSRELLTECPGRSVESIRNEAKQQEIALIFYYVSWSRDSVRIKKVYEDVAQFYEEYVYFASVDCWRLECNCSQTLSITNGGSKKGNPHKWPTLLAFYGGRNSRGLDQSRHLSIQYNDAWSFEALSRFLDNLHRPLQRVHSRLELQRIATHSDAIVLGLFKNANHIDYRKFLKAAIKWLENDPEKGFRFCVVFGNLANNILEGMKSAELPQVLFITEKEIQTFNHTKRGWKSHELILWLQAEVKHISKDISGYNNPSTLAQQLKYGAVLAIFANELDYKRNFYDIMKRSLRRMGYRDLNGIDCLAYWKENINKEAILNKALVYRTELIEMQELNRHKFMCSAMSQLNCEYSPNYRLQDEISVKYIALNSRISQSSPGGSDLLSANRLLNLYKYRACLNYNENNTPEFKLTITKLFRKYIGSVAARSSQNKNRTMAVSILDSSKHRDFLELHDIRNWDRSAATVLIIDPKKEGIYHMQTIFSYENILNFLQSFYNNHLSLVFKSSNIPNVPNLTAAVDRHHQQQQQNHNDELFRIHELNRALFIHLMQQHDIQANTTTICLFYSPDCAFSSLMSHALLQVSVMLQFSSIKIIRVNMQTNDLPWQFIMHTTPILIMFPRGHSGDSHIFPTHLKFDTKNIFGFILAHLPPVDQVRVALASCRRPGLPSEQLLKCLNFAKTLAMQHIGHNLKLWQIFEDERNIVLERLKQFKDITLDIQQSFRS